MIWIMEKKYKVILIDPPWRYDNQTFGGRKGKSPLSRYSVDLRYPSMKLEEIKNLNIAKLADKDCALCLWVTAPMLDVGIECIKRWGWTYKTILFCWIKKTKYGKDRYNLGYWSLGNIELVLLGTRGSPKRQKKNVKQLVRAEVTKHSHKPEEVRKRIEELFGDVPRIEVFATEKVEGWDAIGYNIDGKDIREIL